MTNRLLLACLLVLSFSLHAAEKPLEGEYLYKVSTVRAAPGALAELLAWVAVVEESGYFRDAGVARPMILRHSQGDQWDLMIITPMHSFSQWYEKSAVSRRADAATRHEQILGQAEALIAFDEDLFASGPPLEQVRAAYESNELYHIEMFHAAPGETARLAEQRRMENNYLVATGQAPNMIFLRTGGSDVDVFTIGFHRSLESFAAPAKVSDEDKEAAAQAAGFKDRADLSFYLRSLISGHHDTLASKIN